MAILANRGVIRNNTREYGRFFLYLGRRVVAIGLLVASLFLLKFSSPAPMQNVVSEVGGRALQVTEYVYSSFMHSVFSLYERFTYFKELEVENLRLKLENDRLKKASAQVHALKLENTSLREILNAPLSRDKSVVIARVVGLSITPYSSRAIINSGATSSIQVDDVVKGSSGGVLGKIVEVSDNYSKVMLLGDSDFRIPVLSTQNHAHGILVSQGKDLKIIYSEESQKYTVGETIYTSGDGKLFASGLPVGTISKIVDNEVYVTPIEQINPAGFVSISASLSRDF